MYLDVKNLKNSGSDIKYYAMFSILAFRGFKNYILYQQFSTLAAY